MNIVNVSLDCELLGAKRLGTNAHRHLHSGLLMSAALNAVSDNKLASTFNNNLNAIGTMRSLLRSSHFSRRLPAILREREFNLSHTNLNKIFTC
jgi:hypothetical protein